MKTKTNAVWIGLLLAVCAPAAQAENGSSSGTRGGGERVGPSLRDLVDEGACIVMEGKSFVNRNAPRLQSILDRFALTHWIFARRLRTEIDALHICMLDGRLKHVTTNDADGYVYYGTSGAPMVAIRDDNTVYIERPSFEALSADSKAYLLIHEAMHAFIDMDAKRRNQKVRNIVHALNEAVKTPMSHADFGLQIEFSEVNMIAKTDKFDPIHADYLTMLDESRSEISRQVAAQRVDRWLSQADDAWFPQADHKVKWDLVHKLRNDLVLLIRKRDYSALKASALAGADLKQVEAPFTLAEIAAMSADLEGLKLLRQIDPTLLSPLNENELSEPSGSRYDCMPISQYVLEKYPKWHKRRPCLTGPLQVALGLGTLDYGQGEDYQKVAPAELKKWLAVISFILEDPALNLGTQWIWFEGRDDARLAYGGSLVRSSGLFRAAALMKAGMERCDPAYLETFKKFLSHAGLYRGNYREGTGEPGKVYVHNGWKDNRYGYAYLDEYTLWTPPTDWAYDLCLPYSQALENAGHQVYLHPRQTPRGLISGPEAVCRLIEKEWRELKPAKSCR